jgi:transcriptional regulator with XRE-family HTH domain
MLEFGALLRVYRNLCHLSQEEMAELLGVSQPVYSRMEAGKKAISLRVLQRVADRSGYTIETLIIAHLLLDENLDAIEKGPRDGAAIALLAIAEEHRRHCPPGIKDGAALGILIGASQQHKVSKGEGA